MKTKTFITFLFASLLFWGCTKQPVADFYSDKDSYIAGETIVLTNQTIDGDHYIWKLPNGQESTSLNTEYYTDANSATTSLTFTLEAYSKNNKKTDEISKTVNIIEDKGDVVFWQSEGSNITTVACYGLTANITNNYSSIPDCGASGCACFNDIPSGYHNFEATDGTYSWSGEVYVYAGNCSKMQLTYAKAQKCDTPTPSSSKNMQ